MNKFIRWQGLLGFIAIVGIILAITILFLDTWIRLITQQVLEQSTGAEVNIESASHTFSPFGVTLNAIQLTDPNKPTQNQLQAEKITANIDLMPLLLNKVIIDDLSMTGVAFSQPRESEGAVYRKPEQQSWEQKLFGEEGARVPTVDEILAKSPLKTTKAIEQVQLAYETHSDSLKAHYENLYDKQKLADYKKRIEVLTETEYKNPSELAAAKKEIDKLLAELKQDKQKLEEFNQALGEAKQDLAPKLANLKAAPGQDYDQLKGLIAGDQAAIEDITKTVFGDKAAIWTDYLLSAYKIAAPLMNGEKKQKQTRQDGRWIAFSDEAELPDIWVKKADISLRWQQEDIASFWTDITHQHDKINKPTTFKIDSAASSLWQSLRVDGNFKLLSSGLEAAQKWNLKGIKLDNLDLLEEEKLTTKITKAMLSSNGTLAIDKGIFDGGGSIDLSQLAMAASGSNNLTKVIAETLNKLDGLKINTNISGSVEQPDVSFSSDLDKRLAQSMLANLSGDQQTKLKDLREKLDSKASAVLGEKNGQFSQWLEWEKLVSGDLASINEMLSTQFNSLIDKEKDKLKNKLKDRLFGN